jgi:hypothetical protein
MAAASSVRDPWTVPRESVTVTVTVVQRARCPAAPGSGPRTPGPGPREGRVVLTPEPSKGPNQGLQPKDIGMTCDILGIREDALDHDNR